jgi:hypothetical protein
MGAGSWPPDTSPYVWQDHWWDAAGQPKTMTAQIFFDAGVTNQLQRVDYDIDPDCPWRFLIVVRADQVRLSQQLPTAPGQRNGSISRAQLVSRGLDVFLDIASITVGVAG